MSQILSVTCDNASNNDKMIDELEDIVEEFSGSINHTRCFLHIINLVVKSVLRQFDLPKKQADAKLGEAETELLRLAGNLDNEENEAQKDFDGEEEEDNVEGWIDEQKEMTVKAREELSVSVQPLRLMLTKVNQIL
jgi:hypothetical protein